MSNLEASVNFYKSAFAMKERARFTRVDREEVVLDSADGRGSRLVLMNYTSGPARNYQQNPGKIVFYVKDVSAVAAAVVAAGGTTSTPVPFAGRMVSFGRDKDQNLIEITSEPTAVHSYVSAFGIGVSNLEAAKKFYVETLDMKVLTKLSVTKPTGPTTTGPWYDEYILTSGVGRGSAIVLMTYTDGTAKNYTNNPIKLGLRVKDPQAYASRIAASGNRVTLDPVNYGERQLGNTMIGYARDADGTVLEILDSPN
ncbi:MAG: hypothetical protein HY855_19225 [Burkholderiales bacterium]|nr:hypothetical protein [Burkholderiales bacterium]